MEHLPLAGIAKHIEVCLMQALPYAGTALCRRIHLNLMQALPLTGIMMHTQHTHFFDSNIYKVPCHRFSLNHCSIRHFPARPSPTCIAPPPFTTALITLATDPTKDSSLYDQPCMQLVHLHCFAKCQKRCDLKVT